MNRSALVGFNNENKKVEKVPSIFSVENSCNKVNIDEFLSVSIKSIYQLNIVESMAGNWKKSFSNNDIYHFIFNYREDYEGDDAYIISNGTDYFITGGKKYDLEYRWDQYSKDMKSEEFPCENDICTYNTEGFIVSTKDDKNNWVPPKGTRVEPSSPPEEKYWKGSPLFSSE